MSYTLLATVGKSPGAVTGMVKALSELEPEPKSPSRLLLIRTSGDSEVADSASRIRHYVKDRYPNTEITQDYIIPEPDLTHRRAAYAFQKLVVDAVEEETRRGQRLILNITGGRSSMGAMLAVAGHLYSDHVDGMYHFWVSPDVEKLGTLEAVLARQHAVRPADRAEIERGLFPPPAEYHLVPLPVFALSFTREHVEAVSSLHAYYEANDERDRALVNTVLKAMPGRLSGEQAVALYDSLRAVLVDGIGADNYLPEFIDLMQQTGLVESEVEIEGWLYRLGRIDLSNADATDELLKWLGEIQASSKTPWWNDTERRAEFRQEMIEWVDFVDVLVERVIKIAGSIQERAIVPGVVAYMVATQNIDPALLLALLR